MAQAAFKQWKCTGSGAGTEVDCSKSPNFLWADERDANPANHPIPIPQASGTAYSFEVYLRWECTTAPDNQCINFKVWGDNEPPATNVIIEVAATESGVTPVKTESAVSGMTRQDTNYYSSGTALALTVVPVDDKIDAIGEKTFYLVMQMEVSVGAPSGNLETMTFNLSYEES